MNNYKKQNTLMILVIFVLVGVLVGVTFAFFNYTRTGSANLLTVGNINFLSSYERVELTNLFPTTASNATDEVEVSIEGSTSYADGIEYKVTFVDIENTVNGKTIPISYVAEVSQDANENDTLGTSSNDYFNERGGNTTIYNITSTGEITNNKEVLKGFITTDDEMDGTLVIKAYLDSSKIAISDTYPEETIRTVKTTGYSSSNCETALTGVVNASTYCASAEALQDAIDNEDLTSAQITLLVNAGLVEEYTNGTTSNWVNGRTVLTTEEWNSLQANGLSFKIKVEANEGVWIEDGPVNACTFDVSPVHVPKYTINKQV